MKKIIPAAGAFALALVVAPSAAADETGSTAIDITTECGTATITYTNNTEWPYWGDRQVGDEEGRSDEETHGVTPDQVIGNGPLQGETYGYAYEPVEIPVGESVTQVVELDEDAHGGSVEVDAWIKRGPERDHFLNPAPVTVETDCETDPPTTTPDDSDTSTPPNDDDNGEDDDQDGDEADDNGDAPVPTPQEGHLDVTG